MASSEVQRKLTAILVTDVVAYSRLMGDDPEGTLQTLTEYREVFSDKTQEYKGRVVNAPGDSLLAEFPSVLDSVSCAVDIQRELAERNQELPDTRRMDFRIGVNLGDVLVKDGDLYGDGVNIAARLESLAEPGGICISGKAFEEVKNRLPLHYEFIGEQSVKNIAEPVRTYRILSKPGAAAHRVLQAKRGVASSWRKGLLIAAAGLLLALGAVVAAFFTTSTGRFVWNFYLRPAPSAEAAAAVLSPIIALPDEPSIAVLSFANLSDDPKQDYLADGMTEDIITELSKLRDLLVISRTAVLPYKGKSVALKQIGRELGVRFVLEGSVRISGDRVRITAQLIDVATGSHLWAERYDRELKDVFAVQDEITGKIVTELDVKLIEGEQARSKHGITDNLEAYEFFRRGMESFLRFTPEGNAQARLFFEKAGALEPDFALGHVWLGFTHLLDVQFWSQSPAESMKRAREEANKSLALDDSLGEAHALLGEVYLNQGQHDKAIAALEEAVTLSPGGANVAAHMALVLNYSGRGDEALVQIKRAMRLSPNYPGWYLPNLAQAYGSKGQFEEAIAIWKEYINRTPTGLRHLPFTTLAVYYGALGMEKEARAAAAEALRRKPDFSVGEYDRFPFKDRKRIEEIKSLLRKAGLPD